MRPATENENLLLTHIGEALVSLQVLEETLTIALVLKLEVNYPLQETVDHVRNKISSGLKLTLGGSIKKASEQEAFTDIILKDLRLLREERNWLVHRSIEGFYNDQPTVFIRRTVSIARESVRLKQVIEEDLIAFGELHGLDTSCLKSHREI